MTAFTVNDEASAGGMSANAIALGAANRLLFDMRILGLPGSNLTYTSSLWASSSLQNVANPFRLRRDDILQAAKASLSHLPITTAGVNGKISVMRGDFVAAEIPWAVPGSGQLAAPTLTADVTPNAGSALVRDVTKIKRLFAAYRDASGVTPLGTYRQVWLGLGSGRLGIGYELIPGTGLGSSVGQTLTLVPYDKVEDKEAAPVNVPLSWEMGPFTYGATTSTIGASGTIPEGTVVQLLECASIGGQRFASGSVQSVTIGPSGAIGIWAGYSSTDLFSPNGSKVRAERSTLVKLSTHTGWTEIIGNGNSIPIANVFSDGGIPTPPTSLTLTTINRVDVTLTYGNSSMQGPNFNTRFEFKGFIQGRQVFGTGAVKSGNTYSSWNGWASVSGAGTALYYRYSAGGDSLQNAEFTIVGPYNNLHLDYDAKTPRGDQYYTEGQPISVDVNIPAKANVTGVLIYAQNFTTSNGSTVNESELGTVKQLIYDGPYVPQFNWIGAVVNANPTIATDNTTTNRPATTVGDVGWPVTDPESILVEAGDSVLCEIAGTATLPIKTSVQVSLPVEFL